MKKPRSFIITLILLSTCLTLCFCAWASSAHKATEATPITHPRLPGQVVIRAAGRGNPYINFSDGIELPSSYAISTEGQQQLSQRIAQPRVMASADFDEDGVPDLIVGHAAAEGGILSLYRGNVDSIYPYSPEAQKHKAQARFTDAAFLPTADLFDVAHAPDFMMVGDFDADGHSDVIVAAHASAALYLLPGDGRGQFGPTRLVRLPGAVTAAMSGDLNRADGLSDLVIGIAGNDGPKLLVFEGPEGAVNASPEVLSLPAPASSVALGRFDDDYLIDFAVAAGTELLIVRGRDRHLSSGSRNQTQRPEANIERRSFGFAIKSIAAGDFTGRHQIDIVVLSSEGTIHLTGGKKAQDASRKATTRKYDERNTAQTIGKFPGANHMICARVSGRSADDLLILNGPGNQLQILTSDGPDASVEAGGATKGSTVSPIRLAGSFDLQGEPIALLPMRLNPSPINDLVILQSGHVAPAVLKRQAAATFIVNQADDHDDGLCDGGDCTLREAINAANASPGADTIGFNIPGAGPRTISLTMALPTIADPVTIDGTTQPGFAGSPVVELNGNMMPVDGLFITAGNSTVRGLVLNRFSNSGIFSITNGNNIIEGNFIGTDVTGNVALGNDAGVRILFTANNRVGGTAAAARNLISGNSIRGIDISFSGANDNVVEGNFIGTNVTGSVPLGNGFIGIDVFAGSGNIIGGITAASRNIISGNGSFGVIIRDSSASGNRVQANFIGTDVTGTNALGEQSLGVRINAPSTNIGGTSAAMRNIISASSNTGLEIQNPEATGNIAQGNFIGTDVTGTIPLSNTLGVNMAVTDNNLIGGTTPGARNIISGNTLDGILIFASSANNVVQGNFIGTDVTGTTKLANKRFGIFLLDSSANIIGGTAAGARNLISGNDNDGVLMQGNNTNGNQVKGNFIGTDVTGVSALGNGGIGVSIGNFASDNTVGGIESGAGNVIAFNGGRGVLVDTAVNDAILSNSIFSNSDIGIDLGTNGVTLNDPCDTDFGSNNLQNFPVLNSASSNGITTSIQGTLNSSPNTTFLIQFFANNSCDPSGFGEGETFIGSTSVTTDNNCNASFTVTLPAAVGAGKRITATATAPLNNTSEFSACIEVIRVVEFDLCLQDESGGDILQVNSTTGSYQFIHCGGVIISGTGAITRRGCLLTLQANGPDRRILARIDTCREIAIASIQVFSQGTTFTITDRNINDNICACSAGTASAELPHIFAYNLDIL